jgi:hypothetical protein
MSTFRMKWSNPAGIGPLLYQIDYYRKTATASTVRLTNELVDQWESDGVAPRPPSGLVRLSLALTLGPAPQSGAA